MPIGLYGAVDQPGMMIEITVLKISSGGLVPSDLGASVNRDLVKYFYLSSCVTKFCAIELHQPVSKTGNNERRSSL